MLEENFKMEPPTPIEEHMKVEEPTSFTNPASIDISAAPTDTTITV